MSPRRWEDRIQDIVEAITEIFTFVGSMEFKDFQNDAKTMRAVELDLILIGEAANAIPEEIQGIYPHIPWHLMRGMRNRLVHTYFEVSPQVLWDTIQQDLPPMAKLLEDLIHK